MNAPAQKSSAYETAIRLFIFVVVVAMMYFLKSVLVPLMFAILLSMALYPVARLFEKWKLGKAAASILSVIFGVIVIGLIIYFFVHQVIIIGTSNSEGIVDEIIAGLKNFETWVTDTFGLQRGEIISKLESESSNIASQSATYLSSFVGSAGGMLANVVLIPLFIFFLLYYRDFFIEFFFRAFKSSGSEKIKETLGKIYDVVQSYLVGLVSVMGIVAVLNTVGLLILGIDYAWFFGILASVLLLIPYVGIAIGSILPAFFALATKDNSWYALGVIGWFQVVQFLEGNFITPNIVGGKVSVNPLVAIISLLLGGLLFGLAGLILAIPLVAVLKVALDADPATEPFGFLIGEPEKYHLKKHSRLIVLKKWMMMEKKNENENPDL